MKFALGSKSQSKIEIVKKVVKQLFNTEENTITGYAVESKVPETPYDQETFIGARNRAVGLKAINSKDDYYIGLESGLIERYGHIYEEAWAAVVDKNNNEWFGYSSGLKVPDYVLNKMSALKKPHGDIMAMIETENKEDLRKLNNDTWGTYSGGKILRTVSLEEALRNALIQVASAEGGLYAIKS